jgi:two-component system, NtrC family, nitrogen regulation sensor histidine kinase NtrY
VDQEVLRYVGDIRAAVRRFKNLQAERADIELTFGVIFAMLALLLVMSAIWFGLSFASRLASPIAALVEGAERVRAGDLEVQLAEMGELGEFQTLGRTFNSMTTQLRAQRQELVEANRQVDQRRRFTEAVLAGVAAGVVGLDPEGRIRYPNRMAGELLGIDLEQHRDTPLADLLPEVGPLIERAHRSFAATTEGQITHTTADGVHTFLVRVTVETGGDAGSVATFTDITDLLDAQRKAAWSDIARRIAHEIKNPLTPIQLSAERLKRRYLPQITDDPQTFQLCTDTIIRQVDGLRQLVDEFSNFARLPAPRMEPVDLTDIAREGISLQQIAFADVTFSLEGANEPMQIVADAGQLGRVLTNLLQNAAEAIERRLENEGPESEPGMVTLALKRDGDMAVIAISDNGAGLPGHLRDRLADPYVTTRAKGTGLGLAIVQKIANDHGGSLQFQDRPGGGAEVIVTIAVAPQAQGQTHGA